MVIGLKTKTRRSPTVQVDYLIHIQEIKPWPPSQSLKTLRSALIKWENGDRSSGSTKSAIPTLGSGVGEGKIEFNESFRLSATLHRELSVKAGDPDAFQKNCLEFNLYEPRRDKTVKGQLLGTAIIDLAEYGVIKESLSISAQMNCQRNFRNAAQPIVYITIQPVSKGRTRSSSRDSLMREALLDKNGGESVSTLMNEEYAEEAELASIADDDVSSHSSLAVSSSANEANGGLPSQNEEISSEAVKDGTVGAVKENILPSKLALNESDTMSRSARHEYQKGNSSRSSSIDLSSGPGSPVNGHSSLSNFSESSIMSVPEEIMAPGVQSSSSSVSTSILQVNGEDDEETWRPSRNGLEEAGNASVVHNGPTDKDGYNKPVNGQADQILDEIKHITPEAPVYRSPQDATTKQALIGIDTISYTRVNPGVKGNNITSDRLRHVKSVRSSSDSGRSNGIVRSNQFLEEVKEAVVVGDAQNGSRFLSSERKDFKAYPKETKNTFADSKVQQLEHRIKMLEGELREAAAIEVALYSVVAEHGSSMNKVHAPARRLYRLYLYACKEKSQSRRATAARSAVSGLVSVAKACGNDVPRLTFWLSNAVVLRVTIRQAIGDSELPVSAGLSIDRTSDGELNNKRSSPLKWESKKALNERNGDWDDPKTFTSALEKIEAWIFSRIIESVWWQTLTPHMQSAAAKAVNTAGISNSSKKYRRLSSSGDQEQENLSLDLWKKAFKDARERICPVRAGGHECGCLHVLPRLIMEQCVARLDVAMFNAILRESADDIPSDPVSDPISDPKVLPILAGKFSFGAGARLKNVIGNWSRWLTDLFGIDTDDLFEEENEDEDDYDERQDTTFKSFYLLNALSDLLMLPKDMLLSRSIRKEVCPTFGASMIRRIIHSFVPDEFCPDPIPKVVLEALDSVDSIDNGEELVTDYPCIAAPALYSPPSAASMAGIIGEIGNPQLRRSGSSMLRRSYTSDDELDDLDSPLTCIFTDSLRGSPTPAKPNLISKQNSQNSIRYQLLREVWMDNA